MLDGELCVAAGATEATDDEDADEDWAAEAGDWGLTTVGIT